LAPGPHQVLIELMDANHGLLAQEMIKFEVPKQQAPQSASTTNEKEPVMSVATLPRSSSSSTALVRPFRFKYPEAALVDLRRRVNEARWPDQETVKDQSQGVQLARMKELARYWGTTYDWRKAEAKLNSYPQFVTNIDGLDIHFIHVRS